MSTETKTKLYRNGATSPISFTDCKVTQTEKALTTRLEEIQQQVQVRQQNAKVQHDLGLQGIQSQDAAYQQEKAESMRRCSLHAGNLEGIHRALPEILADLGLPGSANAAQVLEVKKLTETSAAREAGLIFGPRLGNHWVTAGQVVLMFSSTAMSTVSVGLLLHMISPSHPFDPPIKLIVPAICGLVVSGGITLFSKTAWDSNGKKFGIGKPTWQVWAGCAALTLVTLLFTNALTQFDAKALQLIGAGRSKLLGLPPMSQETARLCGFLFGGAYLIVSALAGFIGGYNSSAKTTVAATIEEDEAKKKADRSRDVLVQEALATLAEKDMLEKSLREEKDAQAKRDAEYARQRAAAIQALTPIPDKPTPQEQAEIDTLRARARAAGIRHDAYVYSSGSMVTEGGEV